MQEGTSLKELFYVGSVDATELAHTLSSFYNMASQHGDRVAYNRPDDQVALVAVYDDGDLVDVISGPGLRDEDIDKVKVEIEELLRPSFGVVARDILFAAYPVRECLDMRPQIQILPPPSDAPQPPVTMAKHPFVLEYSVATSKNWNVAARRRNSELRKWKLLLNVLIEWGVTEVGNDQDWTLFVDEQDGKAHMRVEHLQRGYYVEGFVGQAENFTDPSSIPPMIEMATQEYLGQLGIGPGRTLRTAPFVGELVRRFPTLPLVLQERFLRAAFWYRQALRRGAVSASYIALVCAIETLIEREKGDKVCTECKRPLGKSSTRRFVEFVRSHSAGSHDDDGLLAELYRTRSALAHRGRLLRLDEDSMYALDPKSSGESWERMRTRHLTRGVLLSWLASRFSGG